MKTGTEFTSATTNHADHPNGVPGLPLMSPEGEVLAKKSGTLPAMKTTIQGQPSNPVHASMDRVFKR